MSAYELVKAVHVACVAASLTGFVARFGLAMRGSGVLQHPIARILPHVNDTILLAAAIAMLIMLQLNPVASGWLLAKIAGLVAYIAFGMVAMRRTRPWGARKAAFAAALVTFAYVVSVAFAKSPLGPAARLLT